MLSGHRQLSRAHHYLPEKPTLDDHHENAQTLEFFKPLLFQVFDPDPQFQSCVFIFVGVLDVTGS